MGPHSPNSRAGLAAGRTLLCPEQALRPGKAEKCRCAASLDAFGDREKRNKARAMLVVKVK